MQMEKLLLFLLLFFSILLSPAAYTPPDHFFINCGSDTNTNVSGYPNRTFIGDLIYPGPLSFTKQKSKVITNSQISDVLYQTARVFKQQSFYEFDIDTAGIYLVRFHFFNSTDVSTAVFYVSTARFSQLKNFTVPRSSTNDSNSPLIDEFLLNITQGKFSIYFTPHGSSFAFINALEVFLAPANFIPDKVPTPPNKSYSGILSHALQTIYRINVGGEKVTPDNDTLWRTWIPDDKFLYNSSMAKKSTPSSARPNYEKGNVTVYIAPAPVYKTAIEMNTNGSNYPDTSNVTWSFNVSKNSRHFVRVHFCNIVGKSVGSIIFNLYLNGNYSRKIDPHEIVGELGVPFCLDFVVDSDESGAMNISIGPSKDSLDTYTAFLNGVEIMEIMGESSVVIKPDKSTKTVFPVVGPVVGGLLVCVLAVGLFIVLKKRKRTSVKTSVWSLFSGHGGGSSDSKGTYRTINVSQVPNLNLSLIIPFTEIQSATKNFDEKLVIGRGGFGNVYRGILKNGLTVAVKRSQPGSGQGFDEFLTEIMILSKIRHRHLVSLIGYCDERFEMILVYEFMEKGTLRDHLYNTDLPFLSWKQRLEICIGAASGLNYLHKGSTGGIIHRDIKTTNILLDENFNAKVADFGLSKSAPLNETHVNTGIKGTFGYLDPEYFQTQQLTEKSDVYSFGVVLLEVLCARPVIISRDPQLPMEQVNLAEWGLLCHRKGLLDTIVDPSIKGEINLNSLRKFAETAEKCLQEDSVDRPSMGDVLWDLEYALQLQQTGLYREPHEDSTIEATSDLQMINVQRLPSHSLQIERDELLILGESITDESLPSASEVFSQLRINNAR
ncbi:hypothetical protein SLEP1_g8255 [Rubroshorea leprosula]|uniref:Protein kinase domain-containing protein n=1 Tax=Rubroshorea leprosula TaxID=152421 RepID=A0AAV5I150_9ROSI|nr:hypothetical protein SLEP1_g8255 [Rubroshorea leprosula]